MNGAERTLGPQRKGNQYLSISKSNHTLCLLSTCYVPSLGSGLSSGGSLEDWEAERETSGKVEALPSPPHWTPPRGLRSIQGPQGAESFPQAIPTLPTPRAWAPGLFSLHPVSLMHRAEVASSGESSWLECSSAVLFFLGYSRGCGNSHRCGEGKPPSPLPRS